MNASDFTYGIEIECGIPGDVIRARGIEVGGYYSNGIQVPGLPDGWRAKRDGSVEFDYGDMVPVEIISPVLKGEDGLRQIAAVAETLRSWGTKVNRSCGCHVHVGVPHDVAVVRRLSAKVTCYEKALVASAGDRTRDGNYYCRSAGDVLRGLNYRAANLADAGVPASDDDERWGQHRYRVLNLTNIASGKRDTVEFRVFAPTLKTERLLSYVSLSVGLVQRSMTEQKASKWDSKAARLNGSRMMSKLLRHLGWVTGPFASRPAGVIEAAGLPGMEDRVRVLRKLARAYDRAE